MKTRGKYYEAIINVSLLLFSLTISYLFGDLIVRKSLARVIKDYDVGHYHFMEPLFGHHPLLGHVGLPNKSSDYRNQKITHNKIGLRGPYHEPNDTGAVRIVFIGDSQTWGYGVNDSETIPMQVEKMFSGQNEEKYEVINLGVPSYSTVQAYLSYFIFGFRYNPKWVIHINFPNDHTDNEEIFFDGIFHPVVFEIENNTLCFGGIPVPREHGFFSHEMIQAMKDYSEGSRLNLISLIIHNLKRNSSDQSLNYYQQNFPEAFNQISCIQNAESYNIDGKVISVKLQTLLKNYLAAQGVNYISVIIPDPYAFPEVSASLKKITGLLQQNHVEILDFNQWVNNKHLNKKEIFLDGYDSHLSAPASLFLSKLIFERLNVPTPSRPRL